jgi:hypothetical protein
MGLLLVEEDQVQLLLINKNIFIFQFFIIFMKKRVVIALLIVLLLFMPVAYAFSFSDFFDNLFNRFKQGPLFSLPYAERRLREAVHKEFLPGTYYRSCENGMCVKKSCAAPCNVPNECGSNSECGYNECQDGFCIRIHDPGTTQSDQCSENLNCRHRECEDVGGGVVHDWRCVWKMSVGTDNCTSHQQCQPGQECPAGQYEIECSIGLGDIDWDHQCYGNACCFESTDCALKGDCYGGNTESHYLFPEVSQDDIFAICNNSEWMECDYQENCVYCWNHHWKTDCSGSDCWVKAGELDVGEYDDTVTEECCGDDWYEYYVCNPTDSSDCACCSNESYIVENGICLEDLDECEYGEDCASGDCFYLTSGNVCGNCSVYAGNLCSPHGTCMGGGSCMDGKCNPLRSSCPAGGADYCGSDFCGEPLDCVDGNGDGLIDDYYDSCIDCALFADGTVCAKNAPGSPLGVCQNGECFVGEPSLEGYMRIATGKFNYWSGEVIDLT